MYLCPKKKVSLRTKLNQNNDDMKKMMCWVMVVGCWAMVALGVTAQNVREKILLDEGWKFAFGHAADPAKDFGCGTEYFNYLTKANSIHNEGPYAQKFDDTSWQTVTVPHDWVTTLPYAREASHSHGYKTVGYKYPETSVGWYRKVIHIPAGDLGKHIALQFDGIFRHAQVWFNGFYMGTEPSGYATQVYDVTEYVNYGGENLICVRADATLEEGWFYEGGGIYRDAWLLKSAAVSVAPFGTFVYADLKPNTHHPTPDTPYDQATLHVETEVNNSSLSSQTCEVSQRLLDADGQTVARSNAQTLTLQPKQTLNLQFSIFNIQSPHLWSPSDPYLYKVETTVKVDGRVVDVYETTTGIREIMFDADRGFLLNGQPLKLKGVNLHQDHAGVGSAIPDALQAWRIRQLKAFGCNAYRASHNPMTPALLDPTRHSTIANAGGGEMIKGLDVVGFNYIMQNSVDQRKKENPTWKIVGTEETTGCGTRGVYFNPQSSIFNPQSSHMVAMNRDTTHHHVENVIERGWKFYAERPWAAGVFYWTGFDYRGEPNPLAYPAHDSEFGILDYCGFWKDEAWYLKSWWTDEPVLHIFPHWNLKGHEGETVELWAYSNCDEVELTVNGKKLGRQTMPKNGHLKWNAIYRPGRVVAVGYKNGRRVMTQTIETTKPASRLVVKADRTLLKADGRDVAVVTIEVQDAKGRVVPDACPVLTFCLEGAGHILGAGNGDPSYLGDDHPRQQDCREFTIPAFNGLAQVLVQSSRQPSSLTLTAQSEGLTYGSVSIVTSPRSE